MMALFIILALYYFFLLRRYYSPTDRYIDPYILRAITLQFIIVGGLVLVEAGTYWLIRKRIYRPLLANLHVICMYLTLIGTPIIFLLIQIFFNGFRAGEIGEVRMSGIGLARTIFFWLCVLAGHLCFIATIVKSFSRPQLEQPNADNSANILDEFAQ